MCRKLVINQSFLKASRSGSNAGLAHSSASTYSPEEWVPGVDNDRIRIGCFRIGVVHHRLRPTG
jgi:hypothetical protein